MRRRASRSGPILRRLASPKTPSALAYPFPRPYPSSSASSSGKCTTSTNRTAPNLLEDTSAPRPSFARPSRGITSTCLSSPALLAFLLWMTLTPSLFELLAPALRLDISPVFFLPRSPLALPISVSRSPVPLSISAFSHAPLSVLHFGSIPGM